ncbi:MAG TPA: BON domain-containing protein, partial [Chitinophagaceae bacterium]|nr:BON domain-containing protein [Chitinophagaceae bacterium]
MKQIHLKPLLLAGLFSACLHFTSCKGGAKDSDIQASFNEKVQADAGLSGITATVNDGVVTLNGQCPD